MEESSSSKGPLSFNTSFSGKSSPRGSPTFRRLGSSRASRRDARGSAGRFLWVRNNRVVFWLMLIAVWAYVGFHVQSKWAHEDHNKAEFVGYKSKSRGGGAGDEEVMAPPKERVLVEAKKAADLRVDANLLRKEKEDSERPRKRRRRTGRGVVKPAESTYGSPAEDANEFMLPRTNGSHGLIVGPFGRIEDSVFGWSPGKKRGKCNRKGDFAALVRSRTFMLIFHELSMTGAPLSMLELATEILSCGGTVSAIVLSRKGGLMGELSRRGIKVLHDRDRPSFKLATKVDLIIAGSAVCSSWIEPYLEYFPAGSGHIVWWIMENRREYFDRSKHLLNRVKMLAFLSDSQSKQWLSWCDEEKITFYLQPMVVPLSVNEELAFMAGIPCSLNTPEFSVDKMLEKRDLLRNTVREEMGLGSNDMLVMSLSSINPAKGQMFLLEAANLVAEHRVTLKDSKSFELVGAQKLPGVVHQNQTISAGSNMRLANQTDKLMENIPKINSTRMTSKKKMRKRRAKTETEGDQRKFRKVLSVATGQQENLKVLLGSVGSKSNKMLYVESIMKYLSKHSKLLKTVLWTPATTRVASLYAAADVYVMNAQGLGETFGRVTIEAMAFGLPVLGTDAGGTREIVDHSVTGLLHPVGHEGTEVLAQHIQYLLSRPSARKKMGMNGRQKVQDKYLKNQTYESFGKVLSKTITQRLKLTNAK